MLALGLKETFSYTYIKAVTSWYIFKNIHKNNNNKTLISLIISYISSIHFDTPSHADLWIYIFFVRR